MKKLGTLLLLLGVVACGGNGPAEETTAKDTAAEETAEAAAQSSPEDGVVVDVSGAVEDGLTGPGHFTCIDSGEYGLADRIVISSHDDFSADRSLLFELPTDAVPGTYDLVGQGNMDSELGVDYRVSLKLGADSLGVGNYDEQVEGQLTLDALPSAPGDPVRGSFRFSAVDTEAKRVEAEGRLDFAAPDDRMFFCDEGTA